jgi:hypothetical protein
MLTWRLCLATVLAARRGDDYGVSLLCADVPGDEGPLFMRVLRLFANAPDVVPGPFAEVPDWQLQRALFDVAGL